MRKCIASITVLKWLDRKRRYEGLQKACDGVACRCFAIKVSLLAAGIAGLSFQALRHPKTYKQNPKYTPDFGDVDVH